MNRQFTKDVVLLYSEPWAEFKAEVERQIATTTALFPEAKDFRITQERDPYSNDRDLALTYKRLENDKEFKKRRQLEEEHQKWQEKREKVEFERLKKKFEGK